MFIMTGQRRFPYDGTRSSRSLSGPFPPLRISPVLRPRTRGSGDNRSRRGTSGSRAAGVRTAESGRTGRRAYQVLAEVSPEAFMPKLADALPPHRQTWPAPPSSTPPARSGPTSTPAEASTYKARTTCGKVDGCGTRPLPAYVRVLRENRASGRTSSSMTRRRPTEPRYGGPSFPLWSTLIAV